MATEPPPSWSFPRWQARAHARPDLILLAVQVGLALLFLLNRSSGTDAAIGGLPLDDSWIHLVYARSVAAFRGFEYNPGRQEAGFTSPLWVMLLAPLFWLTSLFGGQLVYGVKVLGVAVAWATSAVAWRLTYRLTGSKTAAYAAALLIAVDPFLSFAKLSGMEVLLAGGVMLYAMWSLAEGCVLGASVALAIAPLARPENLVLWALAMPCLGVLLWRDGRGLARWVLAVLPSFLTIGGWVAFCLLVNGRPLPNTYYAKHVAGGALIELRNLYAAVEMIALEPWTFLGSGVVLFGLGAAALLRERESRLTRVLVVAAPLVFLLGVAHAHSLVQVWPFYFHRYVEPAIPMLLVPIGVGVGCVADALRTASRSLLAVGGLAVCALALVRLPTTLLAKADLYSNNCENIDEMNVAAARWLADHVPPGEWIVANDAGASRFFSGHPILDLIGLNDHDVLFRSSGERLGTVAPRYYSIFPFMRRSLGARGRDLQTKWSVTAKNYTICDCPGQHVITVFEAGSDKAPALANVLDEHAAETLGRVLRAAPNGSPVWIASRGDDPAAVDLAAALSETFKRAGWDVRSLSSTNIRTRAGVFVFAASAEPPAYVTVARDALSEAGLNPMFATDYRAFYDEMTRTRPGFQGFAFAPEQTFLIVVGPPPKNRGE